MKFFRTTFGGNSVGRASSRAVAASLCHAKAGSSGASPHRTLPQSAFTMVEVAISLAIIGIALVAIIGVLPLGMNVQRDNREATVINQDASIFLEAIRNGSFGLNDLTNYVYAITNSWVKYDSKGVVQNINADGYSFKGSQITKPIPTPPFFPITNGLRIIGLLSTPEFTDLNFTPADNLLNGGYSNHVVAYVRSISGPAVEKPPQDNAIIQADAFTYFIYAVNAPVATSLPPAWLARSYNAGDQVFYPPPPNSTLWQATATTAPSDVPGVTTPSPWTQNFYSKQLGANSHELRLTFLWPVRPNGKLGNGRQTYRALIAGQLTQTNQPGYTPPLYFYQSQSFTNAP
jgi:prepilin-type N-terminal cleavage/methylation domain-containing protein